MGALAVDGRHVDAKDAHETIRLILDARSLSSCCPGHSARDADILEFAPMCQDALVDAGDLLDEIGEDTFGTDRFPVFGKEDDGWRGDEFLQSPATFEPLASPEGRGGIAGVLVVEVRNVVEEGVAHGSTLVPCIHGVDGF